MAVTHTYTLTVTNTAKIITEVFTFILQIKSSKVITIYIIPYISILFSD